MNLILCKTNKNINGNGVLLYRRSKFKSATKRLKPQTFVQRTVKPTLILNNQ